MEWRHRCQSSRNRAGNPAFWLISRIPTFLREAPTFLAKIAIIVVVLVAVRRHFVRKSSAETLMIASLRLAIKFTFHSNIRQKSLTVTNYLNK